MPPHGLVAAKESSGSDGAPKPARQADRKTDENRQAGAASWIWYGTALGTDRSLDSEQCSGLEIPRLLDHSSRFAAGMDGWWL